MSLLDQVSIARKERLARIASHAVTDTPIDLKRRKTIPIREYLVPEPPKPLPMPAQVIPFDPPFVSSFTADAIEAAREAGLVSERPMILVPSAAPRIAEIQFLVAKAYGVTVLDLCSIRKPKFIVRPRQVAMYLCRHLTSRSMPEIGRMFGGRDHTTVIHAIRRIADLVKIEPELAAQVSAISITLTGKADP